MRILILHSRYRSGPVSGENRVAEEEAELLRTGGHQVQLWDRLPAVDGLQLAKTAARAVSSPAMAREVRTVIKATGAEIVHCHNWFPAFSPAVFGAAAEEGAAVVMTLHNYRLMCLAGSFLRQGRLCEDCLGRAVWRGVLHGCYRDSVLGSGVLAGALTVHRKLGSFEAVRLFLAVSPYVRQKHIDSGMDPGRIVVKPNFSWPGVRRCGPGDYFVYLGRLTPEKGVAHLLQVWRTVGAPLLVVGAGPQEEELRSLAPARVEFAGAVAPTEVSGILARARALLVPSTWYEAQPRSIVEAYAAGVPVITNAIGGLAEAVTDGQTGLVVKTGDVAAWRAAVERLLDDREAVRLGEAAYRHWDEHFSPGRGLELLEACYQQALGQESATGSCSTR